MAATMYSDTVQTVLDTIRQEQVIAVIRANTADGALWGAQELIDCGFRIIEVTFTVPQADMVIQTLADRNPDVLLGAGTVMNQLHGVKALGAGAQFLVSPVLDDRMVQWGVEHEVLTIPGVMTPSEVHRAFMLGSAAVKIFPAKQAGGPDYIKALVEPMGPIPVIVTGGVGFDDFTEYLGKGAMAVGLGGHLIPVTAIGERNGKEIRKRAKSFRERLGKYREKRGISE